MRRYKPKKLYEWCAEIAYVAGLIASDGCLYNDYRHINLTSSEIEQLEIVRQLLGLHGAIKVKNNGFGGKGYYIQFSDVSLYDFLFKAGITPAKSKSILQVDVPDLYYPDFLQGYFDGDGSIYSYWDTRWKNSLMYYTAFCSASPDFLKWLKSQNNRLLKLQSGSIRKSNRCQILAYAKKDSKILYDFMYYSDDIPYLKRKRSKFIDLFTQDPYAVKALHARVP